MTDYLHEKTEWQCELAKGKMFGVLVVEKADGNIGFLAAYSGLLANRNDWPYFVPPIFDFLQPDGYFKQEEARISDINLQIREMEGSGQIQGQAKRLKSLQEERDSAVEDYRQKMAAAKLTRDQIRKEICEGLRPQSEEQQLIAESQFMKAELHRIKKRFIPLLQQEEEVLQHTRHLLQRMRHERHQRSDALQRWLFDRFVVYNAKGESRTLTEIFSTTPQGTPPAGAGECCAPKLLQAAYLLKVHPLCMAEFWWGDSPAGEIRHHGQYYPACTGKCRPILQFMLQGLDVEEPVTPEDQGNLQPTILYEDNSIVVLNKPAGLLSVPGKATDHSVKQFLSRRYPNAEGPLIVHRLDMDTSGLMVAALNLSVYHHLQKQFASHIIKKRYVALLDGLLPAGFPQEGTICLPLAPDLSDRPRQRIDYTHGKIAVTRYQVVSERGDTTHVHLWPQTGRTHQLRVHCAHSQGLGTPILGDPLYGRRDKRLYLHAESISFEHPDTGRWMEFSEKADF
jgi:tRNA pseudouridine32 synthase/23S rRNA pseudouridine746 synthase